MEKNLNVHPHPIDDLRINLRALEQVHQEVLNKMAQYRSLLKIANNSLDRCIARTEGLIDQAERLAMNPDLLPQDCNKTIGNASA